MGSQPRPVVGAAIIRDAHVLAARRTAPPEAAGRWELPGGKVEPGERPSDAVEREILEELGCAVDVTGWLTGSTPIGTTHVLRIATARIVRGEPVPVEHDEIRWVEADALLDLDWLDPDRPFLPEVAHLLRQEVPVHPVRAVLFEEAEAEAVRRRLVADGYVARVVRERLAGEDDDEDHPWAVVTDAPEFMVELVIDEYDGWIDTEAVPGAGAPSSTPPPDLPTAPRRVGGGKPRIEP